MNLALTCQELWNWLGTLHYSKLYLQGVTYAFVEVAIGPSLPVLCAYGHSGYGLMVLGGGRTYQVQKVN